jgi:hypothetical protein
MTELVTPEESRVKRWLPVPLTALGAAIGITGWWLYATIDPEPGAGSCRAHALYTEVLRASGAMSSCQDVKQQLYLSLALLTVGAAAFVVGWHLTLAPRLSRVPRITLPMTAASALLALLAGLVTAGALGWQHVQHSRELGRRHTAEAALARLVLPADMGLPPRPRHCFSSADMRCARSALPPRALTAELIALVHGKLEPACLGGTRLLGCEVRAKGQIAGYPAVAIAGPEIYSANDGPIPPGATRVRVGKRLTGLYVSGSGVEVMLLIPEQ